MMISCKRSCRRPSLGVKWWGYSLSILFITCINNNVYAFKWGTQPNRPRLLENTIPEETETGTLREQYASSNDDSRVIPVSSSSTARKRLFEYSDEEEQDMMMAHTERREERDKKLMKLKEDILNIELSRVRNKAKNNNHEYDLQIERNQLYQHRLDFNLQY